MTNLGFTFYPQDWWSSDTFFELNATQRYIYLECLFVMYANNGFMKTNKTIVEGRLRCEISSEDWNEVTSKFVTEDGMFTHISVNKRMRKIAANRQNGAKGGRPKKTQKTQLENPKETQVETQNNPPLEKEIESKIEIENKKKDVVVEKTTTLPTTTAPRFGICSTHEQLKAVMKSSFSWKDMFGKQSGISNPADSDIWIDRFVDFAIANGKGDLILKVNEAQSYCLHWVTKRIAAGETASGKPKNGSGTTDHGVRFTKDGRIIPMGRVKHG